MHTVKSMERRFEKENEKMTEMPEQEEAIFFKLGDKNSAIPAGHRCTRHAWGRSHSGGDLLHRRCHFVRHQQGTYPSWNGQRYSPYVDTQLPVGRTGSRAFPGRTCTIWRGWHNCSRFGLIF